MEIDQPVSEVPIDLSLYEYDPGIQMPIPPAATDMSAAPTPVPEPVISHLAAGQKINITYIHMVDANQGWGIGGLAQAEDHVFRTENGGKTWRDVTPPEPAPEEGTAVTALGFFSDASDAWVVYGPPVDSDTVPPGLRVWFTHDGAASWSYGVIDRNDYGHPALVFSPLYLYFSDSQHGWVLVYTGRGRQTDYVALYSTQDGGKTWTNVEDSSTDWYEIQAGVKTGMIFVDAQTGWVTRDLLEATYADIIITQDGGVTWTSVDLPVPAGISDWSNNNQLCGTYSPLAFSAQSVFVLVECRDYGAPGPGVEQDYLYSTMDGGQTWQSASLPPGFKVADPPAGGLFFTDMQTGLALGRWIYRTDDGGKT